MLAIKKSLIALLTTTSVSTATSVPTMSYLNNYQDPYYQSDDEILLKKMIHENIDRDSIYFKTDTKYHYKDQEYMDRDSIVNQFLEKNPIIAERTTSNPSKIIKDYEYQQLDEKKVYDTKQDNYVKVYKNALGKVVLPTCASSTPGQKGCVVSDKTAQQRALDSYVNGGLIRPKYTYSFGGSQNWYDSPTEAENAYKNSEFTIKKSLFYYYDGQYYNAFNKSDLDVLKKTKLNAGYYFNGVNSDNVDTNKEIQTFADTNSNFENRLKQKLAKIFRANINELVDYTTEINIEIKAPDKEWIAGFWTANKKRIDFDSKTNQLIIKNPLRDGGLNVNHLLNDLHDGSSSNWTSDMIHSKGFFNQDCDDYNRHNYSGEVKGVSFGFQLNIAGNGCDPKYPDTHPAMITTKWVKEKMNNDISLKTNDNAVNPLLKKLMNLSSFTSPNWNAKDIADSIDLYNEGKTDEIALKTYENMSPLNWDQRFTDKMFEIYYEKLKFVLFKIDDKDDKFDFKNDSSSQVHKDWTYGSRTDPAKFSYQKSRKHYEEDILGTDIKNTTGKNDEQVTWTKSSAGDFTTSWENWKNNFYYLDQENKTTKTPLNMIPLKQMYYVDANKEQDISEFSDLMGETIASSTVKAKDIAFISSEKILRKQYFIYDINGQVSISASDEQSAITKLKNKVNLNYTYMNINEAKQISDQDLNWKDIISDGLYTVYKFKSSIGSWLYFMSFDSAYKQFQNQVGLIAGISQETVTYYRYIFNYNNQRYIFDWSNDQEIDEIVKKIYQIMKP